MGDHSEWKRLRNPLLCPLGWTYFADLHRSHLLLNPHPPGYPTLDLPPLSEKVLGLAKRKARPSRESIPSSGKAVGRSLGRPDAGSDYMDETAGLIKEVTEMLERNHMKLFKPMD